MYGCYIATPSAEASRRKGGGERGTGNGYTDWPPAGAAVNILSPFRRGDGGREKPRRELAHSSPPSPTAAPGSPFFSHLRGTSSLSIGPPTVSHPYKLKPDLMGWKRAARSSCIQLSLLSVLQPHPGHLYRVSCKKILSLSPAIPFDLRLAFSGHAGCIVVGNRGAIDDPRSISTGDKNIFIR